MADENTHMTCFDFTKWKICLGVGVFYRLSTLVQILGHKQGISLIHKLFGRPMLFSYQEAREITMNLDRQLSKRVRIGSRYIVIWKYFNHAKWNMHLSCVTCNLYDSQHPLGDNQSETPRNDYITNNIKTRLLISISIASKLMWLFSFLK